MQQGNKMKNTVFSYLAILLSLLIMDGIWLGIVAQESYQQAMGHIMREQPLVWPWVVFYLFYPLAILILAIKTHQSSQPHYLFAWRGLVLGAAAYGAYNLTNIALLADWPLMITLKDWLWGSCLTATAAWIGGRVWLKFT